MAFTKTMHSNKTIVKHVGHRPSNHTGRNSTEKAQHRGKKGNQTLDTATPLNNSSNGSDSSSGGQGNDSSRSDSGDSKSKTSGSDDSSQKNDGHDDNSDDKNNSNKFGLSGGFGRLGFGKGFHGANGSNTNLTCENVNETDGRLQYTGPWVLESKDPNGRVFTTHTTTSSGSQVNITFSGVTITVIGIVHQSNNTIPPAVASYTIDDDDSVELALPFITTNGNRTSIPNQQFFESTLLRPGPHTLLINVTSDGSPYTLDGLRICSESGTSIAAALVPTSTQSPSSHLVQIIVVSVIGGVVLIVLLILLGIFFFHRRMRAFRKRQTAASPIGGWLRQQGELQWTSSDSIMRANPSHLSSGDPYDREEKMARANGESQSRRSSGAASIASEVAVDRPPPAVLRADDARQANTMSSTANLPLPPATTPEVRLTLPPRPPLPAKDFPIPF